MTTWFDVLIPPAALCINVFAQILCARAKMPLLKSVFAGFLAGLAAALLATRSGSGGMAANAAIYAGLGYCYFHFLNLGETARRIRLMRELYEAREPLSAAELELRYSPAEMLERRIQRLVNTGQLREQNDRLYVTGGSVSLMADALVLCKKIYYGRDRENL